MIFSLYQPLVKSLIRSNLVKGLTRNTVWNMLPAYGLPKFHKQTYWKIATQILGEITKQPLIQGYPSQWKIPHDIMVEEVFPSVNKYWIKGEMTLYNADTDSYIQQHMSFYSDANLGKDGWLGQFMKRYTPSYEEGDLSIVDANINLIIHQEGDPY